MKSIILISSLACIPTAWAILACRPEGPVVPAPRNLSHSSLLKRVGADLTAVLDKAAKGEIKAGWPVENVSFSLGLVSLGQEDPGVPIWEHHHLASANVNGTKKADRNSQYLIGSVSKVISDAIVLKSGIELDDPITKWVPQLKNDSSLVPWNNITIRALMTHLAGIPPNYGFSEFYYLKDFFKSLGFPDAPVEDYGPCGIIGLNKGCTKQQFLEGMSDVYPIAPPNARPVYSNIAFTILAYAVEAVTGKNYTVQLRDILTGPLGMNSTRPSPGDEELAVIPPMDNTWGSDYGEFAPGGGLVSTLRDLSIFTYSILDQSLLSSPSAVREWLQPRTFAGGPNSFVGAPWEIYQPPIQGDLVLTPEHPHTISIYAKGGGAYGYNSQIAVIPQYGISLVLLTAGDQSALFLLYDALLSVLVPAVDEAAREEAKTTGFDGSFASPASTCAGASGGVACTNATFKLDADSLVLTSLSRNGSDILKAFATIWAVTVGSFIPPLDNLPLRVFPTEIPGTPARLADGRSVVLEDWRLWWGVSIEGDTELPVKGHQSSDCLLWAFADWLYYAGEPIDRVVFVRDAATGAVLGVEVPFLRSGFLARG